MQNESELSTLKTELGAPFTVYKMGTGTKKVVMIHGWSGRGTQFFKIAEKLKQEYSLFAIDAPAHGRHKGKRTHMLDFIDALETAETEYGPFDYAIGHSLGGMAIFNALERNAHYSKMVIIGTPASVSNVVTDFSEKVKASKKVRDGIIRYIEKRYEMDVEAVSTEVLSRKYNPKGLIIHDERDQDVPVLNAHQIARSWDNGQLMITQELGHRKVLMDGEVVKLIYDFLKN